MKITRTTKVYCERALLIGSLALLFSGCGDGDSIDSDKEKDASTSEDAATNPPDSGSTDDAGSTDGGSTEDGGSIDAGDSGSIDGGDIDGADGGIDAAAPDADAAPACEALEVPDAATQCEQDGQTLSIAGSYVDDFNFPWEIDSCSINGDAVTGFSNASGIGYVVSQNSCTALFNPGKWSRNDFTWFSVDGGAPTLYLCTQIYDADSEEDALSAPPADATDPTTGGCGLGALTFAWSKLESANVPDGGGDPVPVDASSDGGQIVDDGDAGSDASLDASDAN